MPLQDGFLRISPTLAVPLEEFELTFVRASGPGGQHVNKTSSAVQLRFDVDGSKSLDDKLRRRLKDIAGNRLTNAGEIVLTAQRFRSREQNRRDAFDRIEKLLLRASRVRKRRRKTQVPRAARERRLDDKRKRAEKKRLRGTPSRYD